MNARWVAGLLAGGLGLGAATAAEGDLAIAFRCEPWEVGADVSPETRTAAAETLARRIEAIRGAGASAKVEARDAGVSLAIPPAAKEDEGLLLRLCERRGRIEFRLRAPNDTEQEYRERRLEGGVAPPAGWTWATAEEGGETFLLEIPEAKARAALDAVPVGAEHDDARGKARSAYEDACRASVFANEPGTTATVSHSMSTHGAQFLHHTSVRFELPEARRAAFETFTGANVGRTLCVVVDGKVHVAPVIRTALPGAGELRLPGSGYTDEGAREMAALFAGGALPCRLVRQKESR